MRAASVPLDQGASDVVVPVYVNLRLVTNMFTNPDDLPPTTWVVPVFEPDLVSDLQMIVFRKVADHLDLVANETNLTMWVLHR